MGMSLRGRVHAGDPDAFRELFDEHARSVYNLGFRVTGSWSTAEDVVSLTFLEAWRLRTRIDVGAEAGSLSPWLLGIATNVSRNVRRAARRYADALARLPTLEPVPDPANDVASRVDGREELGRAMAALAALSTPDREVLVLCVGSGLDYNQAAQALGVPVGTVRSRLSRARRKLARLTTEGIRRQPARGREPHAPGGQIRDDRTEAVRLAEEDIR